MDFNKIGQRIRDERIKLGLSREQLAEIVNLSPNYIGQIERGERSMSLETLIKLSACFHASLDYLIKGDAMPPNESEKSEIEVLINRCSKKELLMVKSVIKAMLPHLND